MLRKFIGLLSGVIAFTAVFSFSSETARSVVAQPAPQVVILWHNASGPALDGLHWIINQYQTSHPDIQIVARYIDGDLQTAYLNAFRAQRSPDIFLGESSWAGSLAELNAIISVDARLNDSLTARAYPTAWQTVRYHGETFGIPNSAECLALYYNSSLVGQLPNNFDDLLSKVKGKTPAALNMAYDFYTTAGLYFGLGGRLIDDNDQSLLNVNETLTKYLALLQKSYAANPLTTLLPGAVPTMSDTPFRLGQSAYLIDGNWKLADLDRYLNLHLRVAMLPEISNGHPWQPLVGTKAFFLSANSDRLDAAFDFATYALDRVPQTVTAALGELPPVNLNARVDNTLLMTFTKQCSAGQAISPSPKLTAYWRALDHATFAVTVNGEAPDITAISAINQITVQSITATPQP